MSMRMTRCSGDGFCHEWVAGCDSLQPMATTRSASCTVRLARAEPNTPVTPIDSGWRSSIVPFPLIVVTTGVALRSARRQTSCGAPENVTPPPARITGRSAARSMATAAVTSASSGAERKRG